MISLQCIYPDNFNASECYYLLLSQRKGMKTINGTIPRDRVEGIFTDAEVITSYSEIWLSVIPPPDQIYNAFPIIESEIPACPFTLATKTIAPTTSSRWHNPQV